MVCDNKYEVLPLTEGNGTYKVTVFLNVTGNSYATVMSETISVTLRNQFEPYIRPNQYVDYKASTKVVKKAATLTKGCKTDIAKVKKVYKYVIKNYKYDKKKAATVKNDYLPNLDSIYKKKKGWITGAIYFNGKKWKLMDPTLASTAKSSKSIMKYIGNGRNYKAKYSY